MYKMDSFALFNKYAWRKNDVEVIEYGGKIWINQGYLLTELSIILTNFKKRDVKHKRVVNINLVECLLKILWH